MNKYLHHYILQLQGITARAVQYLPTPIQHKMSNAIGIKQAKYQGLDAHFKLIAAARPYIANKQLIDGNAEQSRKRFKQEISSTRYQSTPVKAVHDFDINSINNNHTNGKGFNHPLPLRHYRPYLTHRHTAVAPPLIVFLHGGGFVVGNLDTHDEACRLLASYAGAHVLSVDYRLAPEHKAPAAVEDAIAATLWAFNNAKELGIDANRIVIAGDSAGGHIAAVVAQQLKDHQPPIALQVLIYPIIDLHNNSYPSRKNYGEQLFFTSADVKAATQHYLTGANLLSNDAVIAPLHYVTPQLAPALIVTAEFDMLHDEGKLYADTLQHKGVKTEYVRIDGLGHGFITMTAINKESYKATVTIAKQIKQLLDNV